MDTQMRKRLNETAKEIADKKFPKHRASENNRRAREDYQLCRDSCIIGIELGYKKAIALAKKWLKEEVFRNYKGNFEFIGDYTNREELLKYFEADMNKLWEEKK